jgi:hypothetical protein
VTFIPIASFLAGALLSLLLPTLLLIALAVWHLWFIRRMPDSAFGRSRTGGAGEAAVPPEATAKTPTEGP